MQLRPAPHALLLLLALLVASVGCGGRDRISLRVLFAGSLIIPCRALEEAYEAQRPDVDVLMEGHGSSR